MQVSQSTAFGYIDTALREIVHEPAERLRQLELQRLDEMQRAIFAQACGGDTTAIQTVLKIMDRRARLEGLDKTQGGGAVNNIMNLVVPPKIEVHFPDGAKVINGEVAAPR
jgi:hypothetical protein